MAYLLLSLGSKNSTKTIEKKLMPYFNKFNTNYYYADYWSILI